MSCFLYMHRDMSKHEDIWKIGVAKTPYSAVRARQKFCWDKFGLDYLYFGNPYHISSLEERAKQYFYPRSGKYLNRIGGQTELFSIDIKLLKGFIDTQISQFEYQVREIVLDKPYTASSSGSCPFGIPSENQVDGWLEKKFHELFSCDSWSGLRLKTRKARLNSSLMFSELFEVNE
jgi:hypothetical protein